MFIRKQTTSAAGFDENQIKYIEDHFNAHFIGDFCLKNKDGSWANLPFAVFYQPNPPADRPDCTKYFAMYWKGTDLMITDGSSAFSEPIAGITAKNGEIIYSRYRWDYRQSEDGSVWIDGGRDYIRSGLNTDCLSSIVQLVIKEDRLVVKGMEDVNMCQFADTIEEVITEKMNNKTPFTGHDITTEVRKKLPNKNVAHSEVNAHVKYLFRNSFMTGYTSEVTHINGATPILYSPVTPSTSTSTTNSDDDSEDEQCDCKKGLDSSSRLIIPNKLLKALNLSPGDTALVHLDTNQFHGEPELVISSKAIYNLPLIGSYKVDKSNNIRITKDKLHQIGDYSEFKIALGNDGNVYVSVEEN